LNLLGKVDIRHQIDIGYKIGIQRHNELVDKNRYILDKVLNCIKCCGKHELPQRGHDKKHLQIISAFFVEFTNFVLI